MSREEVRKHLVGFRDVGRKLFGDSWEWVQDSYGDYPQEAVTDPTGPASGLTRVVRGGGWAGADWLDPTRRYSYHGFPLVRTK